MKFTAEAKTHSVYIPPQQGAAIKSAHAAWVRFLEVGAEIAARNRERLLRALQREKRRAKAMKTKA